MWIARDKDGELNLFIAKPIRLKVNWVEEVIGSLSSRNDYTGVVRYVDKINGFENLTWEDNPVEVSLTIINKTA